MTNPEQEAIIDAVLANTLAEQDKKGPDLRQLHPKSHGLVWGELTVEENLPESLRVGIFKHQRSYPIWIRFSNAGGLEERGKFKPDKEIELSQRSMSQQTLDCDTNPNFSDAFYPR